MGRVICVFTFLSNKVAPPARRSGRMFRRHIFRTTQLTVVLLTLLALGSPSDQAASTPAVSSSRRITRSL